VRGYQAIFVPLAALSSPGYSPVGGQPAVYLYIAALEANCMLLPRVARLLWMNYQRIRGSAHAVKASQDAGIKDATGCREVEQVAAGETGLHCDAAGGSPPSDHCAPRPVSVLRRRS